MEDVKGQAQEGRGGAVRLLRGRRSMEDPAFETGQTDHGDHKPPSGAIEAAKSKLSDDVRAEENPRARRRNAQGREARVGRSGCGEGRYAAPTLAATVGRAGRSCARSPMKEVPVSSRH